jgi:hypothetical protein
MVGLARTFAGFLRHDIGRAPCQALAFSKNALAASFPMRSCCAPGGSLFLKKGTRKVVYKLPAEAIDIDDSQKSFSALDEQNTLAPCRIDRALSAAFVGRNVLVLEGDTTRTSSMMASAPGAG